MDNSAAHTSHYAMWNLYNEGIKVMFNCPNTPPFNIIENVFADLKFNLRKRNYTNRDDLIKNEQSEIDIINIYLPQQKSEEETENIINDLIKKNNMESIKDMGKLMSLIKNDYAGEVDMGVVGKIAKSKLGN